MFLILRLKLKVFLHWLIVNLGNFRSQNGRNQLYFAERFILLISLQLIEPVVRSTSSNDRRNNRESCNREQSPLYAGAVTRQSELLPRLFPSKYDKNPSQVLVISVESNCQW